MRRAGQIAIAVIITVSVGLNVLGALSFSDSRGAAPDAQRLTLFETAAPARAAAPAVADEDVRMLTRFIAKELREDEYAANGTAADADKAAALAAHRLVDVVAAHNYHGAEMVEADGAASTEAVAEPRFADDVPLATRVWSVFAAATRELLRTVLLLGPAASGGALWLANYLNVRPPQKALSIALATSAALLLGCYGWGVGGCGAALVGCAANSGAILAQFGAILLTAVPPPTGTRWWPSCSSACGRTSPRGGAAPSCSGGAWRNSAQFCAQLSQALLPFSG